MAIAALFVSAGQVEAQITINIPKLPKIKKDKEKPQPTSETPAASVPASDNPISDVATTQTARRGAPIPGATLTFSNNPDGSNPKTTFSSSEYIYGRLDLGGKTLYDAFAFKALGDRKFYTIHYHFKILEPGNEAWEHDWHNGRRYVLITKADAQKTVWNFDVLAEPTKITTLVGAIDDDISYFNSPAGLYLETRDEDSARSTFPKSGTYTVDITIFGNSFDDWGKPSGETEKFPSATAKIAFQFSGADGRRIVGNAAKARESVEAAKNKQEMYRTMPDWWAKQWTPTDPKLAPARLTPMIKGFIGQWGLTYVKHMIVPFTGPLWVIEKNSLGIPEYRMAKPYIYVIYRDPKDSSCQVGAVYMREGYSGGGTFGAPYLGGIRDVRHIDCAAIK